MPLPLSAPVPGLCKSTVLQRLEAGGWRHPLMTRTTYSSTEWGSAAKHSTVGASGAGAASHDVQHCEAHPKVPAQRDRQQRHAHVVLQVAEELPDAVRAALRG